MITLNDLRTTLIYDKQIMFVILKGNERETLSNKFINLGYYTEEEMFNKLAKVKNCQILTMSLINDKLEIVINSDYEIRR